MPKLRKVSGAWRTASKRYRKVNGAWRPVVFSYRKIDGIWRLVFSDGKSAISTFTYNVDKFNGTHEVALDEYAGKYRMRFRGYVMQGIVAQVGIQVNGIPAGATVSIDWAGYKSDFPQNDMIVDSNYNVLATESVTFMRKTSTFTSTGGLFRVYLNFHSSATVETYIDLFGVSVNGVKIF